MGRTRSHRGGIEEFFAALDLDGTEDSEAIVVGESAALMDEPPFAQAELRGPTAYRIPVSGTPVPTDESAHEGSVPLAGHGRKARD